MTWMPCLEPGCHESVELPEDTIASVLPEDLPPQDHTVELMCPRGHRNTYPVQA